MTTSNQRAGRCNTWECFKAPTKGTDLCPEHLAEAVLDMHLDGDHGCCDDDCEANDGW